MSVQIQWPGVRRPIMQDPKDTDWITSSHYPVQK